MQQLQAGYILDSVYESLLKSHSREKVEGLLGHLCYFDLSCTTELVPTIDDPIVAVVYNLVIRGLPTRASLHLEESFAAAFGRTSLTVNDVGAIAFSLSVGNHPFTNQLYRALHVVDPRIKSREQYQRFKTSWEQLGSRFEEAFLFSEIPRYAGEPLLQLLEPQRDLNTILRYARSVQEGFEKYLAGAIDDFTAQSVDYALELPYPIQGRQGIVIEVDGQQHDQPQQHRLDDLRNDALLKANWEKTVRIKTAEFSNLPTALQPFLKFIENDYITTIIQNYNNPLAAQSEGLEALQFALTPIAVARLQRVIIECILAGQLRLGDESWDLGIIERDVPCGALALEDLRRLFETLFILEGKGRKLPAIRLALYGTPEFKACRLCHHYKQTYRTPADAETANHDLLLDCSVLQRSTLKTAGAIGSNRIQAVIRSSPAPRSLRRIKSRTLLHYPPLLAGNPSSSAIQEITAADERALVIPDRQAALLYLLRTIFRKQDFRPGQLSILNRALQLQNVVGLLPTGSGKSLAYQLAAFLQPGITLVVDPIKSLMKDQYDGLIKAGIDNAVYINSSLKRQERELAIRKLTQGEALFAFVSPERLQIKTFRNQMAEMPERYGQYFSYCVVDEAHCVSEWGHDFRTSYLRLGDNARAFCRQKGAVRSGIQYEPAIPLIGLTATASFDVLSDVQRELGITDDSVLRSQGMERPELQYRVISTTLVQGLPVSDSYEYAAKKAIGERKQAEIIALLKQVPHHLAKINHGAHAIARYSPENFYHSHPDCRHAGIVFCPHKSENSPTGVKSVSSYIIKELPQLKVGTFIGSSGDDEATKRLDEQFSSQSQAGFINNELNLLVATKAFGMGIDKPNVRFSIHLNYPSSIEGYYQEAGRAGRDRKNALCYILFSQHPIDKDVQTFFHKNSFRGQVKETTILNELLEEITYPADSRKYKLSEVIRDELGIETWVNVWVRNNQRRLYVNRGDKDGYGYIDLNDLSGHPEAKGVSIDKAQQVIACVRRWLNESVPRGIDRADWVTQTVLQPSAPGIEKRLAQTEVGEQLSPVVIGFRNDAIRRITDLLVEKVSAQYTERIVLNACHFCHQSEEFIDKLAKEYKKQLSKSVKLPETIHSQLKELFLRVRDEQDTFKAIYRLHIIGVVDDYEVDYNTKTVTLSVTKKNDGDYRNSLYRYLERYLSEERVRQVSATLDVSTAPTIIRKCLECLIGFVYQEIALKREAAIDAMEEACEIGVRQGDGAFRDFLAVYFSSKYYPLLVVDTESGKRAEFTTVWKYAKLTEGNIDNLKHLRGACVRLLTENPENGALLLLKSFAILSAAKQKYFLAEAIDEAMRGFKSFKKIQGIKFDEFLEAVERFQTILLTYSRTHKELITEMADLLLLNHHREWLQEFNNKVLRPS